MQKQKRNKEKKNVKKNKLKINISKLQKFVKLEITAIIQENIEVLCIAYVI